MVDSTDVVGDDMVETFGKQVLAGRATALVMDDDQIIRELARNMLEILGIDVELARDGEEAVALYRRRKEDNRPFDVVILDVHVPGQMGGEEAVKRLIEIHPEVRAVVSSGSGWERVLTHYADYGFCSALPKPYGLAQLRRVLGDAGLHPEVQR